MNNRVFATKGEKKKKKKHGVVRTGASGTLGGSSVLKE